MQLVLIRNKGVAILHLMKLAIQYKIFIRNWNSCEN